MATITRPPNASPELLQFRPRLAFDPVPDWLLDQLSVTVVRDIAAVTIQAQIETLAVQQKALEQTLAIVKRAR